MDNQPGGMPGENAYWMVRKGNHAIDFERAPNHPGTSLA
jgi:hypothetical protein